MEREASCPASIVQSMHIGWQLGLAVGTAPAPPPPPPPPPFPSLTPSRPCSLRPPERVWNRGTPVINHREAFTAKRGETYPLWGIKGTPFCHPQRGPPQGQDAWGRPLAHLGPRAADFGQVPRPTSGHLVRKLGEGRPGLPSRSLCPAFSCMGHPCWEGSEGTAQAGEEVPDGQVGPACLPRRPGQLGGHSPGSGGLAFHLVGTRPLAPAA